MKKWSILLCAVALLPAACDQSQPPKATQRNLILFVTDGLRAGSVNDATAPTMSGLRKRGVDFTNSHSIFPTITMANAAAFATGHYAGDTGIFGNTLFTRSPIPIDPSHRTLTPFIEYIPALREMNAQTEYNRNFINEETFLSAASRSGFQTATIGKQGPAALQSIAHLDDRQTVIIDDATGHRRWLTPGNSEDVALLPDIDMAIADEIGETATPPRGANGATGDCETPGTVAANVAQQRWFTDVATRVILPRFKAADKPFVLVFWSRDPDGSQHNQGDSLGAIAPGINGETAMKGIHNADQSLKRVLETVRKLHLEESTDIIVAADHGFSTISKESSTSSATVRCGELTRALPPGFLTMDIAALLDLPAYDPDNGYTAVGAGKYSQRGNGMIGKDPVNPEVVVAANGGNDLVYLLADSAPQLVKRIVPFLLTQDYVSAVFTNDRLGPVDGALPMRAVNLMGTALTPHPDIVVTFRSFGTGCEDPTLCAAEVADSTLQQGQGMHGTLSRADTHNFMAAIGPSFKPGFKDPAPASNADIGMTIAHLLGLKIDARGTLTGRVLSEALKGGAAVEYSPHVDRATPTADGLATVLKYQTVGDKRYFDAAGIPGRAVGLDEEK